MNLWLEPLAGQATSTRKPQEVWISWVRVCPRGLQELQLLQPKTTLFWSRIRSLWPRRTQLNLNCPLLSKRHQCRRGWIRRTQNGSTLLSARQTIQFRSQTTERGGFKIRQVRLKVEKCCRILMKTTSVQVQQHSPLEPTLQNLHPTQTKSKLIRKDKVPWYPTDSYPIPLLTRTKTSFSCLNWEQGEVAMLVS